MTYDEFENKLRDVKEEFKRAKGCELSTIAQLEEYMLERKSRYMSRGLKSLKGLGL